MHILTQNVGSKQSPTSSVRPCYSRSPVFPLAQRKDFKISVIVYEALNRFGGKNALLHTVHAIQSYPNMSNRSLMFHSE